MKTDAALWSISNLQVLDFSHNHFNGTIPQCFRNLSKSLRVLNLRMNRLYCSIPLNISRGLRIRGSQLEW
ncbi:Leucine-rich repeat - like 10 [Theobroma cacao]|nr:Leucine-rich repeat - like 10 [Theobroma cacao]